MYVNDKASSQGAAGLIPLPSQFERQFKRSFRMSMSTKEPEEARPSHLRSRHDRFTCGFPVAAGLEQPGRAASWEKVELTSYTSSPERFCSSRGLPLPCPHLSGHSSVFCPRVALPNPPGCDAPPAAWCLGCLSLGEQQGLLTSPRSSPAWRGAMKPTSCTHHECQTLCTRLPNVCAHAQVGRADAHPRPVGNGLLGREEKAEERGTQPEVFAA